MPESVTHRAQLADSSIEFFRLGHQHPPVYARPPVRGEHQRDLIQ
jgi:hypothetical protein